MNFESKLTFGDTEVESPTFQARNFQDMDLKEFDFSTMDPESIRRSIFMNADLAGVSLSGIDFHETNLMGANLSGADLSSCNFCNGALSRANMQGADLSRAQFDKHTGLFQTDFRGAVGLTEDQKKKLRKWGAIVD